MGKLRLFQWNKKKSFKRHKKHFILGNFKLYTTFEKQQTKNKAMNSKFLLAVLGATVAGFLGGWLIYGVMLMDFMEQHRENYAGLMYEMPKIWAILVANLATSFLVVWIFQKWANVNTMMKGLTTGLFIALFMGLSFDMYMFASMNLMDTTAVAVDVIATSILGAISGAVAGWILGMGNTEKI